MGTGISEEDVININRLYQQVIDIQVSFRNRAFYYV